MECGHNHLRNMILVVSRSFSYLWAPCLMYLFPFTGVASLVELCLRLIVSREELMKVAEGSYGSDNVAKLIRAAHSRHTNCPLTTDITHLYT